MNDIDKYNARVEMQEYLDELFPEGAYAVTVLGRYWSGLALVTARVFCMDVAEDEEDGLRYRLMIDPRQEPEQEGEYVQPYGPWVRELADEGYPIVEAEIVVGDPDAPSETLKLIAEMAGPRKPKKGARAFLSALREPELFPDGLVQKVTP